MRIPSPGAFLIHKLLISHKRKEIGKKEKDLKKIVYVEEYILKNEDEKRKALKLLEEIPEDWIKTIIKVLEELIETFPEEESIMINLLEMIKKQ